MLCPRCQKPINKAIFYNTEVDYCPICLGIFFEKDELRMVKDEKDKDLNWLDIELWKDEKNFKTFMGKRICPICRLPLYEIYYGNFKVIVDFCILCQGIWLDRGEFKKITEYLKEKADYEILNKYAKNLFEEFKEIFIGPETLREEILDFLTILKILNYKFLTKYPLISENIIRFLRKYA